jgi:hypothetical protein
MDRGFHGPSSPKAGREAMSVRPQNDHLIFSVELCETVGQFINIVLIETKIRD